MVDDFGLPLEGPGYYPGMFDAKRPPLFKAAKKQMAQNDAHHAENMALQRERTMTPFEQAADVYEREPCAVSFLADLHAHLINGYVVSTPRAFAMARPVASRAPQSDILNPMHKFHAGECDAWLIWLCAGDMASLLPCLPYTLPLIGWERSNSLRWWPFAKAVAKIASRPKSAQC